MKRNLHYNLNKFILGLISNLCFIGLFACPIWANAVQDASNYEENFINYESNLENDKNEDLENNNLQLSHQELKANYNGLYFKVVGNLPENAYFTVEEINDSDEIKDCNNAIDYNEPGHYYDILAVYDITLYDGCGNEFQPIDYNEEVQITVTDNLLSPYTDMSVHRIEEDLNPQAIQEDKEIPNTTEMDIVNQMGKSVTFETDHFTKYTVDSLHYVIPDADLGETSETLESSQGTATIEKQAKYNGITWTLFDDGMMILTGDGTNKTAPIYEPTGSSTDTRYGIQAIILKNINDGENYNNFIDDDRKKIKHIYCDCVLYDKCDGLFSYTSYYQEMEYHTLQTFKTGPNFDSSNTTDMNSMFENCTSATIIDVSNFVTSNVTDMGHMFAYCSNVKKIDVKKKPGGIWDTSKVNSMFCMFEQGNSAKFENLDIKDWNVSNVTEMSFMFENCENLTNIDVGTWDISKVTQTYRMFFGCKNVTELNVSNWNTQSLMNIGSMFEYCTNLTSLDVSNWNTSKITLMSYTFCRCYSLEILDISNWNTSQVTDMTAMFWYCEKLKILDVSNWDVSKVKYMGNKYGYEEYGTFGWCLELESLGSTNVKNWNTSSLLSAAGLFKNTSLSDLDVEDWDVSKVQYMGEMFRGCKITELNLNNWNTSSCVDMSGMFMFDYFMTNINLNSFNTVKVTTMQGMFWGCYAIESIDISNFNRNGSSTSNVTNMAHMFQENYNLTNLNISNLDTSNVANMYCMFSDCPNLKELDLSNFDLSAISSVSNLYSFLEYTAPYILKLPKKTNTYTAQLGYQVYDHTSVETYEDVYGDTYEITERCYKNIKDKYYEELSLENARFDNIPFTEIPTNYERGVGDPIRVLYRKYKIEYKKPWSETNMGADDPILNTEYICSYDKYPNSISPESDSNKKISWVKSSTYPSAYESYTIDGESTSFPLNTSFSLSSTNADNYVLRGGKANKFKVIVPASPINLGLNRGSFDIDNIIKVNLLSENDEFWVKVSPSSPTFVMKDTTNTYSSTFNISMDNKKVRYLDVKDKEEDTDGYKSKNLTMNIMGNLTQQGTYNGSFVLNITSGTE